MGIFFKRGTRSSNSNLLYDKNQFDIDGIVLRRYKGTSTSIIVPRGVKIISNIDAPICEQTIQAIFIPRTVKVIAESALGYCLNVYYEGSKQEWESIEIDKYNFDFGIPTVFRYNWDSCYWDMKRH